MHQVCGYKRTLLPGTGSIENNGEDHQIINSYHESRFNSRVIDRPFNSVYRSIVLMVVPRPLTDRKIFLFPIQDSNLDFHLTL